MLGTFCSGMLIFRLTFKCSILQTLFKGKQIIFKVKYGLQGVEKLVTLYAINSPIIRTNLYVWRISIIKKLLDVFH